MFALPGIIGLILFIFVRPFEFFEGLRDIPFLYIFFGLAVFGYAVDLRLGLTRPRPAAQLGWVILFIAWCVLTALVNAPPALMLGGITLLVLVAIYFLVAHGIQTLRAYEIIAGTILASTLWIAAVTVHQGFASSQCVGLAPEEANNRSAMGTGDGRSCEHQRECYHDAPDPELEYRCERVGLFGITSVGEGRVRYVGVLQDPNEVALAVGVGVPLAFAFFQRRRNLKRLGLLLTTLGLSALCIIKTQSRGGLVVFLLVLGVYFLKRYRWKGAVAALVLAAPVMVLGGRSGSEAGTSSGERWEAWFAGMQMWRTSPVLGVGFGEFTTHHFLTAHNSFVLAPAELGFPGMVLWTTVLYVSVKIPWEALKRLQGIPEAEPARLWAMALLASLVGMSAGIFFLSFNYHYVLWVYLGLAGALFAAIKGHLPGWQVRFGWRDLAVLVAADGALTSALFLYTRWQFA